MTASDLLVLGTELPTRWRAGFTWPAASRNNAGEMALFRRSFDLDPVPESFRIFVTADSRYILFVNGQRVGRGPLKGTLQRYHIEEYEIASLLKPGKNVLAVQVYWFGYNGPFSEEHSGYPGLLVQGPASGESIAGVVDTPGEWKGISCDALTWDRTPYTCNAHLFMGGLEQFDARKYPSGWQFPDFEDSEWLMSPLATPLTAVGGDAEAGIIWNFALRDIPALLEEERRFANLLAPSESGINQIGAQEAGEVVLDVGALTTGYPVFTFEGGADRTVEIIYSECVWKRTDKPDDGRPYLWGGGGRLTKAVRDDRENGVLHGYQDTVILPGGDFTYEPVHWRTFWYIKIKVSAGETPLTIKDASYRFTTYPQSKTADFTSSEPDIKRIMDVSWRTFQLCSHETYEDCPGYEQLNYLYDARNEALLSLYLCGETALPKRTIRLFRDTLRPDGMISSRTPSTLRQTIPIFALWWIIMVHDLYRWSGDSEREFVRDCLLTVDAILTYFRNHLRKDGMMGVLPYWNPIGGDDAPGTDLDRGLREGGSTYGTALYLYALETARSLHRNVGYTDDEKRWGNTRHRLRSALDTAWSKKHGVYLEIPGEEEAPISQHTQAMAILSGATKSGQRKKIVKAIEKNVPMAKMTLQQGLPFAQAMRSADRYDIAIHQYMAEYRAMLDLHLSTWLESTGPGVRSDCHAWSAWLPLEFLTTILGVTPEKPGFERIAITPHPVFADASGTLPTPKGEVSVTWTRGRKRFHIEANVPKGVPTTIYLPDGSTKMINGGQFRAESALE
jgi:hypothetical protein